VGSVSKYDELLSVIEESQKTYSTYISEIEKISDEIITRLSSYLDKPEAVQSPGISVSTGRENQVIVTPSSKAFTNNDMQGCWTIPLFFRYHHYDVHFGVTLKIQPEYFSLIHEECTKHITKGNYKEIDAFVECLYATIVSSYRDAIEKFHNEGDIKHLKLFEQ
jgi:hypothetical protein